MLQRVWRKESPPTLLVECKLVRPLLGIYPKEMKTLIQKDTYIPTFIVALFTIAKTWKQPQCQSTDKKIKKMWYVYMCVYVYIYTNNRISLSHKK